MQMSLSPKFPIKLPTIPKWVERYFLQPTETVGQALIWSSATITVTLGTFEFFLLIVTRILPHFARMWWAASSPTDMGGFLMNLLVSVFFGVFLAFLLFGTIFLCWLNVYTVKQTRQSYKDLRVWVISIHKSWKDRNGEQHTFDQLIIVWTRNIDALRILCTAPFQGIGLIWQSIHQKDQQIFSSGVKTLRNSDEMAAIVMTAISKDRSDPDVPVVEQSPPVVPGIFGSVLSACQIRVVGPTGKTSVIDLEGSQLLPLWLYLVVRTRAGDWVKVDDILKDVYGYKDEWVVNKKTGEEEDPREDLLNNFHQQRFTLTKKINDALVEVGLPPTKLFRNERRKNTSSWGITDTIQFQDLALVEHCRGPLATARQTPGTQLDEQALTACEQLSMIAGDLTPLKDYQRMRGIQKLLRETLRTYYPALKCLAQEAHRESQKTTDAEARHCLLRKEEQYWATYALLCADFADRLPGEYDRLNKEGERALRKALSCCKDLHDRERAIILYQEYREIKEKNKEKDDDILWNPEEKTQDLWQEILTLNDAA